MARVITETEIKLAEKIISGEYPHIKNRIITMLNKVVVQVINTAQGLANKLSKEGIIVDYSFSRENEKDRVRVCMEFRLRGIDPVKIGMARAVIETIMSSPDMNVLYDTNVLRQMFTDDIIDRLIELRKKSSSESPDRSGQKPQEG